MAEEERLPNKERRARAREERKRKEAEAARQRKRDTVRNALIAVVVLAVVTAVVLQAVLGGDASIDDQILVGSGEVAEAEQAAGCETLVEREPLEETGHFQGDDAPPIEAIYPDIQPTHSGPHSGQTFPPMTRGTDDQIDERATTHNLEHGAVIVWYDPDQVDQDTADEMGEWAGTLNNSGFKQQGGALVYVSPYQDPGISSGKAVALRAWGTAVDCDEWDETVANGFLAQHFGARGIAPEAGGLAPYPDDVLDLSDEDTTGEADDGGGADDADADEGGADEGGADEGDTDGGGTDDGG